MSLGREQLQRVRVRLAESYPSLFSLLGSLDVGVVFHLHGHIVAANTFATDLAGVPTLEGLTVQDVVSVSEHDVVSERLDRLAQTHAPLGRRRYRPRNDARVKQVEIETAILPADVEGERVMMTLITDVTTQGPRDEAAFRASFATASDAMLVVDLAGRITQANYAATALLGYSLAELTALGVEQLIPHDQRARHVAHRGAFAAAPSARPMRTSATMFALTKSGLSMPVEVSLSPLVLEGVRVTVVMLRDLATRLEAARALRESEARHRSVFEAASDGIFLSTAEGVYVDVNPAGCAMLRCARGDIVGRPISDFVMADDLSRTPLRFGEILSGQRLVVERQMRRFDGTPLDVEVSASVLPGGLVQGMVRDLSDRRRAEQALREAAKLEAVGRLAGGVAHDFNNILTVVLTLTDELQGRLAADPDSLELVADLRGAGRRAADLTRQLLSFARRHPSNPRVVDVNDELRRLTRFLERTLGEDIELEATLAPTLPGVRIDPSQLEQCVVNLAVNARDAMPGGGVLRLCTRVVGHGVELEVSDPGVGMDAETLRHVFEPFFTTKPTGRGTGLGLATVYGIVTQAGGRLDVTSTPGVGTSFRLWLPASDGAVQATVVDQPVSRSGRTGHVLLVEDDDAVRGAVARALKGGGFTVHATNGLESAVSVARSEVRVDLLLSDVVLPRADGLAVADAVLALRPGLRVLFMSGYAPDAQRLARVGPMLPKPFTPDALCDAVDAMLRPR